MNSILLKQTFSSFGRPPFARFLGGLLVASALVVANVWAADASSKVVPTDIAGEDTAIHPFKVHVPENRPHPGRAHGGSGRIRADRRVRGRDGVQGLLRRPGPHRPCASDAIRSRARSWSLGA